MRQPVIEYTIQFYMHAATYTHVHTTLPPYSEYWVQRATSSERDKKQNGDCDSKTQQCSVEKCNVVGAKEDVP